MRRKLILASLSVLLVCAVVPSACADTVYSYTGNTFTTFVDPSNLLPSGVTELTGSLTLTDALGPNFSGSITPLSFSFTDGATTINNINASHFEVSFVTDGSSKIIDWVLKDWISTPSGVTEFFIDSAIPGAVPGDEASYFGGTAFASTDAVGTWTTPEPSALLLLGIGLTVLAFAIWRLQPRLFSRGSRLTSASK